MLGACFFIVSIAESMLNNCLTGGVTATLYLSSHSKTTLICVMYSRQTVAGLNVILE